jgi:hypothetical protein
MNGIARLLIVSGAFLVIAGIAVLLAEKVGVPLGRLPGDFSWKGQRSSFYFPLATSLLLSALLSLLLYLFGRLRP